MPEPTAPRSVYVLTVGLLGVGVATGALSSGPVAALWLLAPLAIALTVAESLQVEFSYGREVRAVDVFEAVLAPVLITFAGPLAVLLAVVSKSVSQHRLGIDRTKAAFNVAQWAAAVGVASLVFRALLGDGAGQAATLGALVLALLAFAVMNEVAMAAVLCLARRVSLRRVLADLGPGYIPHALIWSMNAALGVLLAVAVDAIPATALLLLAPLMFAWWSHQAFLAMRADRARLDGLARAVAGLAVPIDPKDALPGFLDDIRAAFSSTSVQLVMFDEGTLLTSGDVTADPAASIELARLLVADGVLRRASAAGRDENLAASLLAAGHGDALAAPITHGGRLAGALVSYDRAGFEGFEEGEEAVMAALAAAASRAFEKSELLAVIVEERRELGEIVGRSSDGILTLGADGTIESWNPAMEEMTGVPASVAVGSSRVGQLRLRDADGAPVYLEDWPQRGIPDQLRVTATDGTERWLGCSSAVGGGGQTLIVVARDVTRAREIDQMRDDFVATVSHELRTPLATIRGFTELLDPPGGVPFEVQAEAIGRIRRGTSRLERLVANLLEVSRIDGRRGADVIPMELDICDIVGRVVQEVEESWPNRTIEVDTGSGSEAWRAHGSLLSTERILINLLSNALSYADIDPVHLSVRSDGDDGVVISVRDHGPGIAPADCERIFERFERLDTTMQKAGTGLGLYIARSLATAMGAELSVQSQPGEGAEFTLRLRSATQVPHGHLIDLRG
ncbi:MAG: sensor histidine kinase [Microthrixaceae bacterium]